MKKLYFTLVLGFTLFIAHAQDAPFITTWEVGYANGLDITIPTVYMYDYNYTVDFGDGTIENNVPGNITHTYVTPGIYTVTISGVFPSFSSYYYEDAPKLKTIEQWGDNQWLTMMGAFSGCSNLTINATDVPDLSLVNNMNSMFAGATSFNQNINNWDISNVTDISLMFQGATSFNQPLDNWNTSNVTTMSNMFDGATSFNQNINSWDTSHITTMVAIFQFAKAFNQPLNSWDVSNVTSMGFLFNAATSFNQDISNWNVANVTDMSIMFAGATSFNQNINNWNVANVTNMESMFAGATSFNQNINNWDVANVTNMERMFLRATSFNQSLNNWDVSNITNMSAMFSNSSYNQPLNNWDISSVTNMTAMFSNAESFDQDLSSWNFNSNVSLNDFLDYSGMSKENYDLLLASFYEQGLQNITLSAASLLYCNDAIHAGLINSGWNIDGDAYLVNCNTFIPPGAFVTTWKIEQSNLEFVLPINNSYLGEYNYTIDFGDGTLVSNVTDYLPHTYAIPGVYIVSVTGSFPRIYNSGSNGAERLRSIEQWGDIQWTSMQGAFEDCVNMVMNATDVPDLSLVTNMSYMFSKAKKFNGNINNWDVSNVTNISFLFRDAYLFNQPLDNWDVSNVNNINGAFFGAKAFNQNINSWNISNVTSLNYTFYATNSFNQPLDQWDVSNVTNMNRAFYAAKRFNQNINNWDVSNVTDMRYMFCNAIDFNQPLNNWDVSNVTDMSYMFAGHGESGSGNNSFNQDINSWNVANVTDMSYMFASTQYFNQPLNDWDVSNVTDMSAMFLEVSAFNQPLNNWNVSNVSTMERMFSGGIGDIDFNPFNQDINSWDVSNVTNMSLMFNKTSHFNKPLDSWNVSQVTNMERMFRNAISFNQPLNNWDVSAVTSMKDMFHKAYYFNKPLNNWDISNTGNLGNMFGKALSFNQDLSDWTFKSNVTFTSNNDSTRGFVESSGLDVTNYDFLLQRCAELGLHNKSWRANDMFYCNESTHSYLINNLNWTIYGDSMYEYCNTLSGAILYDEDNNGCDTNDLPVTGFMIEVNNGMNNYTTFASNGSYLIGTSDPNLTVSIINLPEYFTATPASETVNFNSGDDAIVDFCISNTSTVEDLNITLLPLTDARPGFDAEYEVVVANMGTQTVTNANVTFSFDSTVQNYISATLTPTATTAGNVSFSITNLAPLSSETFTVTMNTFTPPTVNGGDILNFTAAVTPVANDMTPEDNTFSFSQTVVNSFDPNDKEVLQGSQITIDEADKYLDYIIRFQNTGTASAINVRILDTLDAKLDWDTFMPVSASHDYHIEITNGNKVEFLFDGINLPDETSNEPGSHGFVAFKIKPKSNVQIGDIIYGDARIYFDYNLPIVTNTVSTEIMAPLATQAFTPLEDKVRMYPNPANDNLNINLANGITLSSVTIYNIQGQAIAAFTGEQTNVNISKLTSGIYLVKIATNEGVVNRQLIKK